MSMNQPITFQASKLGGTAYVQSIGGASPTSYLFYDQNKVYTIPGIPASGPDGVGKLTSVEIDGVLYPVSAAVEIQSSEGAHLLPRLTTAERTATTGGSTGKGFIPSAGMQCFDSDLADFVGYDGDNWITLSDKEITVSLSAAEFAAMYETPKLLMPGVPGKLILLQFIRFFFDYQGVAITGGGNFLPQYGNTNHGGGTFTGSTAVSAANVTGISSDTVITRQGSGALIAPAALNGAGIYLSNQTAAFVPNGTTLKVSFTYTLVDFS